MAARMSVTSAKRMGVVLTTYDTRGKKVITPNNKKKINLSPKIRNK